MKRTQLRALNAIAIATFGASAAFAASPCASCHRDQAQAQPSTDMAWALTTPEANRVLKDHPRLTLQRAGYSYAIETHEGKSVYTVTDGKQNLSLPIRWPFGVHAQTWVFEYGGHFYESLVSYYPQAGGLDTTMGDGSIQPRTLVEAMGRELSDFETRSCFECHSTGAVAAGRLKLDGMTPGVQCERCHAGADAHAQGISTGKTAPIPRKLGALTPEETSNFCGQCHRTWERIVRDRLRGPINVRFQPYRLANSKCYDGGDRRMSCTTCHDPHHDVARDAAFYDSKCVACHGQSTATRTAASPKACPIARDGCVNCHMPKVEIPGGHMAFTDHQIRVVRAGEAYPN